MHPPKSIFASMQIPICRDLYRCFPRELPTREDLFRSFRQGFDRDPARAARAVEDDLLHRVVRAAVICEFRMTALEADRVEEAAGRADAAADTAVGIHIAHAAGEAIVRLQLLDRKHHVVPTEGAEGARVARQGQAVAGVQTAVDAPGRLVPFLDLRGGVFLFDGETLRIDRRESVPVRLALGKAHAQLFEDRPLRLAAFLRRAEHGHWIAHLREEIRAAQLRPAGTDDRHGQRIIFVLALETHLARDQLVYVPLFQLGQALHRPADLHGAVHRAPHADLLAAAVAGAGADGGEGIVLPQQLQRVELSALFDQLQHALDGSMRRAGAFAGRRPGGVAVDLVAVAVVLPPVLFAPAPCLGGELLVFIDDRTILRVQLAAEPHRARGADLLALAAGDALVPVHDRAVGGGRAVLVVEQLRAAQGEAVAHRAVADGEDVLPAVSVGDLMHEAVFLGALQQRDHLVVARPLGLAGLHQVVGVIAHLDAALVRQLAAALAAQDHARPADAIADRQLIAVLFEPVGKLLDRQRLALLRDRSLDRDRVEAQPRAARGHHMGDQLQRLLGHLIEELRDLRVLFQKRLVEHQILRAAHDEDRHHILPVPVRVMAVVLHEADVRELVQQGLDLRFLPAGLFGKLRRGGRLAPPHFQHQLRLLVGKQHVEHFVFPTALVHADKAHFGVHAVGQHPRQFYDDRSHVFPLLLPLRVFLIAPSGDIPDQLQRQVSVVRQADRALACVKIGEPVRKGLDSLVAGIEADVLLRRREMDDIPPLPVGGHGPADLLLRLRNGRADRLPDRLQPRPDSLVLQADILIDRLRFEAVMLLIFSRQFPPAFRASPHTHSSTIPLCRDLFSAL